jgi:hypothetical protein
MRHVIQIVCLCDLLTNKLEADLISCYHLHTSNEPFATLTVAVLPTCTATGVSMVEKPFWPTLTLPPVPKENTDAKCLKILPMKFFLPGCNSSMPGN